MSMGCQLVENTGDGQVIQKEESEIVITFLTMT